MEETRSWIWDWGQKILVGKWTNGKTKSLVDYVVGGEYNCGLTNASENRWGSRRALTLDDANYILPIKLGRSKVDSVRRS